MKTISRERRATVNYGKLSEDQIRKLRQDLEIAGGNLDIFNELLTELTPGEVSYTALYGQPVLSNWDLGLCLFWLLRRAGEIVL